MNVFLDSSAMAKRYVREVGSERVSALLGEADGLGLSVLCLPEIVSALCRRRREGAIRAEQYRVAKRALLEDVADAGVVQLNETVVARAVAVLERAPLRSSDAIHVASALEWAADLFVSADDAQCGAARRLGLRVERVG